VDSFVRKCQEYGKKRLHVVSHAVSEEAWNQQWTLPANHFFAEFGKIWQFTVEYYVMDFFAELGFYTDILGFNVKMISEDYAMVVPPEEQFSISFTKVSRKQDASPSNSMSIQFFIRDLQNTYEKLEQLGIKFNLPPMEYDENGLFQRASFNSPNGIQVFLWGMKQISGKSN